MQKNHAAKSQLLNWLTRRGILSHSATPDCGAALAVAPELGIEGLRPSSKGGLCLDDRRIVSLPRQLSTIAQWADRANMQFPPFFINEAGLIAAYRKGHDPVMYSAYRDLLSPRSKFRGAVDFDPLSLDHGGRDETSYWYADLLEYREGTLAGGELFRSTGHWNKTTQVEIFQVLSGRIAVIVAGYAVDGRRYLYCRDCARGDICVVPLGAWHLTYVVDGPAWVFNIYTDVEYAESSPTPTTTAIAQRAKQILPKYYSMPPVEVAAKRGLSGIAFVISQQAADVWGQLMPVMNTDNLGAAIKTSEWLAEDFLYSQEETLANLGHTIHLAQQSGWPTDLIASAETVQVAQILT